MKVDLRMMIAMSGAMWDVWLISLAEGGLCGWFCFWVIFSWILGRWDNPLSYDLYLSRDTFNTEVCLGFNLCLVFSSCSHL
jgi:hypothetical protein